MSGGVRLSEFTKFFSHALDGQWFVYFVVAHQSFEPVWSQIVCSLLVQCTYTIIIEFNEHALHVNQIKYLHRNCACCYFALKQYVFNARNNNEDKGLLFSWKL